MAAAAVALLGGACSSNEDDGARADAEVEARMLPPLVDPGDRARSADQAEVAIEASVSPVSKGARATLQVSADGSWKDVDEAEQDADGNVDFQAPYLDRGQPQVYRVVVDGAGVSDSLDAAVWRDKLQFDEEFDGDTLGPRWTHRAQGYGLTAGRACSAADARMATVADGAASLTVALDPDRQDQCTYDGAHYAHRLNANIGTEASFSFKYGYAAARMKLHRDRGQHSAFWMQPTVPPSEDGPQDGGAEIDVVEWFGDQHPSGGLSNYVYYNDDDGERVKAGSWIDDPDKYGGDWWSKYHVFSVEWSPEGYVFRIDGQVANTLDEGVSGVAQFLILSNVSSNYELEYLPSEGDLPQTTQVDWVRVWKP